MNLLGYLIASWNTRCFHLLLKQCMEWVGPLVVVRKEQLYIGCNLLAPTNLCDDYICLGSDPSINLSINQSNICIGKRDSYIFLHFKTSVLWFYVISFDQHSAQILISPVTRRKRTKNPFQISKCPSYRVWSPCYSCPFTSLHMH